MTFPDGLQAAEHYVALGEQRGLRPSPGFDPEFYRMTNPDLETLSSPLLLHFSEYGSREGRVPAFDPDLVIAAGAMEFRPQDKTILLAVHEASRTGAPILGLNLARILSQTYNVVVVLLRGGELTEHFGRHAWRVLCKPENGVIDPALVLGWAVRAIHAERSLSAALLNSAESASLSGVCYRLGIPSVSMIHEFAQYVFPISKVGGRDVAPLLVEFASRLQDYDLIAHIHGKKSDTIARRSKSGSEFVDRWRTFLYENLLGDRCPALDNLVAAFEQDAELGLTFPEDPHICGWGSNRSTAENLRPRLELKGLPDAIEFPVGNMFVARPKALDPLFAARFSIDDFPTEPIETDGTVMHAIERLLPIVCEEAGFSWRTTRVDGVTR